MIYTLVGSLLMLAGAVALGVLSTPEGGRRSRSRSPTCSERTLGEGTQQLDLPAVRARLPRQGAGVPAARLDARRLPRGAAPGAGRCSRRVLSKVGVYGFLRIVLPILPDASSHFQDVLIVIAVVLDPLRVGARVLAGQRAAGASATPRSRSSASSRSGSSRSTSKGAQGALMQMVNHGLVVAPLFFDHRRARARARAAPSRSPAWAASRSARPCWRRCS